ncbi:MAG TPA: hypothetical protein VGC56_03165 [Allosphingosinicella sp.]|jgi:hypothetical protein
MSETVDPAVIDVVNQSQSATMSHQTELTSGAGKAYHAVAASAALAIQDAVDRLRQTGTLATSASGIALAQFLASGDPRYLEALGPIQAMMEKAVGNAASVCAAMSIAVREFPAG